MKLRGLALFTMLTALLISSMTLSGCTKTVQVPIAVPQAKCPLPDRTRPPLFDAKPDSSGQYVLIPWRDAVELGKYIGSSERWKDLAQTCLDVRESPPLAAVSPDDAKLARLISAMTLSRVHVTVKWETCGAVNAYYFLESKTVVLCNELRLFDPAVTRFIAAHEMAHAIIRQRDVPYTGLSEAAADELAMVYLWKTGLWLDDLPVVTQFWASLGDESWHPSDIHPSNSQRAWATHRFMFDRETRWQVIYNWGRLLENH